MKSQVVAVLPIVMLVLLLLIPNANAEQFPSEDSSWLAWLQSFFESKQPDVTLAVISDRESTSLSKRRLPPSNSHALEAPLDNVIETELEYEEEIHDREVFKAVVTSLAEWNYKKMLRQQSRHRKATERQNQAGVNSTNPGSRHPSAQPLCAAHLIASFWHWASQAEVRLRDRGQCITPSSHSSATHYCIKEALARLVEVKCTSCPLTLRETPVSFFSLDGCRDTLQDIGRKRDEEVVCYGELLGCFRDEGPFDYLDMLPSHPDEIGTRFLLFTHKHRDTPEIISYHNRTSIVASSFNASHPTKIIVHGFGSSCYRLWAIEVRLSLLSVGETNVICVEWENGAGLPNYVRAAVNTRLVGKQLALLVNVLNDLTGTKNHDYHLIGYSLGAHVAGFAGSELKNLSRITGLDPAGPLFESYDPRARLDSSDANLVDVIHSNGESLIMGGLGAWGPMGHMDFYPNGGRMQKGCPNLFLGAVSDIILSTPEESGRSLCNHRRAYKFFTDSVVPGCHFPAFVCESFDKLLEGDCFPCLGDKCGNMGYFADKSSGRGVMYLATREEEPFCANQYRAVMYSSHSAQPISSHGKIELVLVGANDFNETFSLTKGPDVELHSSGKLVRLVVPHPVLTPLSKARLTYTAYHGWLTSGLPRWSFDKLILTDSFGNSFSFCQKGNILQSGVPVTVTLIPGDCNTYLSQNSNSWLGIDLTSTQINEIQEKIAPGFPQSRFSLDNYTASMNHSTNSNSNSNLTRVGHLSWDGTITSGSPTVGVYPYGNLPLSVIQQQIPADVKVASKRPSFYQWPFVSLFTSQTANSLRARAKSLTQLGRKPDPILQLTPPLPFPPTSHIQVETPANARVTVRDEFLNSNRNSYSNLGPLLPIHPPRNRPGVTLTGPVNKPEFDPNLNPNPNPSLNSNPNPSLNSNSNPNHNANSNLNLNHNVNPNSNLNLSPNSSPNLGPHSNFILNSNAHLLNTNLNPNPVNLPWNIGKPSSSGVPQYPSQPRSPQPSFLQPSWTLTHNEQLVTADSPVYYIYQLAPSLTNLANSGFANVPRANPNFYNYFPSTLSPSASALWPVIHYTASKPSDTLSTLPNLALQPSLPQIPSTDAQQQQTPQQQVIQAASPSSRALGSVPRATPQIYHAAAVVPLSRIDEDHVWNTGNQTTMPPRATEAPEPQITPSGSNLNSSEDEYLVKAEIQENKTGFPEILQENIAENSGRSLASSNPVTLLFKASDATLGPMGGLNGESNPLVSVNPVLNIQQSPAAAQPWQNYPYQNVGYGNYQNYQLGPVYPPQVVNNERPPNSWFAPNVWTQVVVSNEEVKNRYIPLNPSDRQSRGLSHYRV